MDFDDSTTMTARTASSARAFARGFRKFPWLALAGSVLLSIAPHAAIAQVTPGPILNPAPTIDRDRADRQEPTIPRAPIPAPLPAPRVPVVAEQAASGGAVGAPLARVRYEGSTLPRERLDRAVAPFVGKPLTQATLQGVANAVSQAYAKSDVALYSVSVPRQVVQNGELLLRVVEGRIATYALRKETPSTPTTLINTHLDRLLRDRPTHKSQLERTLSLLRDIPGQTVDAQLRTTARADELMLDLDVKRKQINVTLELQNNGVTNVTTGVQAQLSVGVHGVLREGDTTRISAYLPFQPDRYQSYALSHATPIGTNGTTLSFGAAHVRTRTAGADIRGKATQASVALSHAFIRSYKRNLTLSASLDGIDSDNYFLDTAFGGFRTRVLRGSATWSVVSKASGYAVSGTVSRGLNALDARPFSGYSVNDFTKANLQFTAVSELGKALTIKATARGQYSRDRLPTTEQSSLGGEGAGMAFRIGELTADRALAGSIELSWKLVGSKSASGPGLSLFGYADGALAHSVARPRFALPARDHSLASAGGGLRVSARGWSATAQVAVPIKRPFEFSDRKARFLFSIGRTV